MSKTEAQRKINQDEIDLSKIFRALLDKWYLFVIAAIIFGALAVTYLIFALPVYEANASVLVKDAKATGGDATQIITDGGMFGAQTNVTNQKAILGSYSVLSKVVENLNMQVTVYNETNFTPYPLYKRSPFKVNINSINKFYQGTQKFYLRLLGSNKFELSIEYDGSQMPDFKYSEIHSWGDNIKTKYFDLKIDRVDTIKFDPEITKYGFVYNDMQTSVANILNNLTIEDVDKTGTIINLTYKDNLTVRAVDLLNNIAKVYLEMELESKIKDANTTLAFIEEQLGTTNDELNTVEKRLEAYRRQTSAINLGEQSRNLLGQLQTTDIEIRKSAVRLKSLDNLAEYVKKNADFAALSPSSFGIDEPLLIQLIEEFRNLQLKRKQASGGTNKITPQIQIIDEQIESTRAGLIENIKSIKNQVGIADASAKDQLKNYESDISKIPEQEREFMNIQRNQDVNQKMYVYLLQKKQQTQIQLNTAAPENKILDPAVAGDKPVAPNKALIAIIAAMLSFIIPSTIVFFQNVFKSTINSRDDIDTATNIPVLGVIGKKEENTKRSLYVYDNPKSVIAECLRSIRTNIQLADPENKKRVILITSTIAGEGKTFMALNLATVFAMQNYKTAIVGFDLRKPRLHKEFNLDNDIGVTNFLRGQTRFEDVAQETHIKNLHLFTAGPIPDNPSELLSHTAMEQLFEKLRANYDYVFIDTPPIGVLSDGFVLMQYSDLNVYVLRENFSKKDFVGTLEELRKEGKVHNMYLILNAADLDKGYGNYGHYHGYNSKYKYYADNEKKPTFFQRLFGKK